MSILINLLPDVRQAKLRDHHRRQLFSGVSILIWAICAGVVVILGLYTAGQAVVINSLSGKIANQKSQLQNVTGLPDALTAEEHLAALPALYQERVYLSKFFTALQTNSPSSYAFNELTVDPSNNLTVSGTATNYTAVATLERSMEAANLGVDGNSSISSNSTSATPYFSNVNIVSTGSVDGGTSFSIQAVISAGVVSGSN